MPARASTIISALLVLTFILMRRDYLISFSYRDNERVGNLHTWWLSQFQIHEPGPVAVLGTLLLLQGTCMGPVFSEPQAQSISTDFMFLFQHEGLIHKGVVRELSPQESEEIFADDYCMWGQGLSSV